MEKVLFIAHSSDLSFPGVKKIDRLYFGAEFCERFLPSADEVSKVVEFCSNNKMELSLVTPWCTENGMKTVKNALKVMPVNSEIIFNDWGGFEGFVQK